MKITYTGFISFYLPNKQGLIFLIACEGVFFFSFQRSYTNKIIYSIAHQYSSMTRKNSSVQLTNHLCLFGKKTWFRDYFKINHSYCYCLLFPKIFSLFNINLGLVWWHFGCSMAKFTLSSLLFQSKALGILSPKNVHRLDQQSALFPDFLWKEEFSV